LSAIAQDSVLKRLEDSPRHHEWVEVNSNKRTIDCFVAYPEKSENTSVLIIIHENRGLTDWVRSFADQIAEAGYLAIAPDLLSDFDQDHTNTASFNSSDDARNAIYQLDPEKVTGDLSAVLDYAKTVPSSNGRVAVAGFCWGGSQSFRFATNSKDIKAALVFYGSAPDKIDEIRKIEAPVYGFYGGNDQRINEGIPATRSMMEEAGKIYDYVIYPGAGHAYMRRGDDPEGGEENKAARDDSWDRLKKILEKL
jgi:carboxymethylenebutenolidase